MNRREMFKAVAAVAVGGPAALELAAAARDDTLRQELMDGFMEFNTVLEHDQPLPPGWASAWPGYRYVKTSRAAVELARSTCR